ncbi:hypothetical protein ACTD5D_21930 [Nocardia takedensis]|uniref:hypothetical protein n=1 Tax=Nocardia takedensis TaxID=259390 RepID=UPI003F768895
MTDKAWIRPGRSIEPGTAWLSGVIVTTLSGGVAVLSASVLGTILVAVSAVAGLVVVLGLLR